MIEQITSRKNALLRHIKKLQTSRSYRELCGDYVADGTKLLEEAVKWDSSLHTVVAVEGTQLCAIPESIRLVYVPRDVMESISMMKSPQGVLFLGKLPTPRPLSFADGAIVLDGIQDPGNLGTILRTADALEVPVVLSDGCADPYSPKTIRASMGAVFRTQPQSAYCEEIAHYCEEQNIILMATTLTETAGDIREVSLQKAAVVIGSEGRGVSEQLLSFAKKHVIIPMNARCESLNAATAATIVMWQMKR